TPAGRTQASLLRTDRLGVALLPTPRQTTWRHRPRSSQASQKASCCNAASDRGGRRELARGGKSLCAQHRTLGLGLARRAGAIADIYSTARPGDEKFRTTALSADRGIADTRTRKFFRSICRLAKGSDTTVGKRQSASDRVAVGLADLETSLQC